MGCCGCSLYASTVTAAIFSMFDCIVYLVYDILMVIAISKYTLLDGSNEKFNNILREGFAKIDDKTEIVVLIGIRLATRAVWFVSAISLFHGNAREYRKILNTWKILTGIRIVYGIAISIYALIKFTKDIGPLDADSEPKKAAEFIIFIAFLELGPIWLIILIALIIYVHQRGIEINGKKNQMTQLHQWGSNGVNHTQHNTTHNNYNQYNGGQTNGGAVQRQPQPQLTSTTTFAAQQPELKRLSAIKLEDEYLRKRSTSSTMFLLPNIQADSVVSIPRVRQPLPPKDYDVKSNIQSFESRAFDGKVYRQVSNVSAMANKRHSYLFNDYVTEPTSNLRKTNSFAGAQKPPVTVNRRSVAGVDEADPKQQVTVNRRSVVGVEELDPLPMFDGNTDVFQPISIKRAKLKN